MVTKLTDRVIEFGKELLKHLDSEDASISACFWLYSSENGNWKLAFASPLTREYGPKRLFQLVQSRILKDPRRTISLSDITVLDDGSDFLKALRSAIRTGPEVTEIQFTNNYIGGVLFEDLLIYRVN